MAKEIKILICFTLTALNLESVKSSTDVITKFSKGFVQVLNDCKKEVNTETDIMVDVTNYWNEKFDLVNRDFGCIILCMSQKLQLLDADAKVHHGNTKDFAMSHSLDEQLADQLVDIIHQCEDQSTGTDLCDIVLDIAKCFRTKIHDLKWAPSMEVVLEEILAGV